MYCPPDPVLPVTSQQCRGNVVKQAEGMDIAGNIFSLQGIDQLKGALVTRYHKNWLAKWVRNDKFDK